MADHLARCAWKCVDPDEFVLGVQADRCGALADVVVIRPARKTDLLLCEFHLNSFIDKWGLHYRVQILNWEDSK